MFHPNSALSEPSNHEVHVRTTFRNNVQLTFTGRVLMLGPSWQVGRTMSSFDPMATAIDWLDFYRAADPSILDLYAPDAALECACVRRH
jgi:hypothetical protein